MQNKFDGLPAFIVLLERMWFPELSFQFLLSMSSVWNITCNLDTYLIFVLFFFFFFSDSQFPIDITPVKRDHDFLDKDLVEPLCR